MTGGIIIAISSRVFRHPYNKLELGKKKHYRTNMKIYLEICTAFEIYLHCFCIFFVTETVFLSDIDTDIETQIEIKYYTVEGRHDFQPCVSDGKFPWHLRSLKNYRFEDN